jgi:glutamate dehydrogenase/leucine dehydrogenase
MGLAATMVPKHALWHLGDEGHVEGGAKTGVRVDPRRLSRGDRIQLLRSLALSLNDLVGPGKHVVAPDVNSDGAALGVMADELSRIRGFEPGSFAGKVVLSGGRSGREPATGFGGAHAVPHALARAKTRGRHAHLELDGARVVFDGFGAAGRHAAKALARMGCVIAGVRNRSGAIYTTDPNGIDADTLHAHLTVGKGTIPQFAQRSGTNAEAVERDELLRLDADILVLASVGGVVTADVATGVLAPMIVELANAPMTPDGEDVLLENGKIIVPDIVASGGGAYASRLELDGVSNAGITVALTRRADEVNSIMWARVDAAGGNLSPRTAAWALGLEVKLKHAGELGRI